MSKSKFYITTPIYYVNAAPHIGHAYSTLAADSMARHARMEVGRDNVLFLTGTDEHGLKIQRSAEKSGKTPHEFVDEVSAKYVTLWERMGISHDDFLRTTEQRHIDTVQFLFSFLREKGYIYKGEYSGRYCVSDEAYVDADVCPDCGNPTEIVSEENYYFRLSGFQARLLALYESDAMEITPVSRKNEIIAMVRRGLQDLSVSRSTFDWGVKVPGDDRHVIYVWLDALANYLTGAGYSRDVDLFLQTWPADVHIVGKEITRFHCIYWPAFLMAVGLELPRRIHAHGWLMIDNAKIGKSKGNAFCVEDTLDYIGNLYAQDREVTQADKDGFATDVLRFYLFRDISFGSDGTFDLDKIIPRYNADLANGLGNLVSRVFTLVDRNFAGVIPLDYRELLEFQILGAEEKTARSYSEGNLTAVWHEALELVRVTDRFFTENQPWKLTDPILLADVLGSALSAIRSVQGMLTPLIPHSMAKLAEAKSSFVLFPRLKEK